MGLLEKFDAISPEPLLLLTQEEQDYCSAHQGAYDNARQSLRELLFQWEEAQDTQRELLKDTGESHAVYLFSGSSVSLSPGRVREHIYEMHRQFIRQLVSYFSSRYHFSLSHEAIFGEMLPKKPEWCHGAEYERRLEEYEAQKDALELQAEDVLKAIQKALGGRSFTEYAIFQLKEQCRNNAWRHQTPMFERDRQTIRFSSAVAYDLEIYSGTKHILRALAFFENQTPGMIPPELAPFFAYRGPGCSSLDFEALTKVSKMRLFKNGRLDIRFTEEAYAVQFVTEYLGTCPPEVSGR